VKARGKELIIDTNALLAGAEKEPAVMKILAEAARVTLPVVALGEFRFGAMRSRHQVEYLGWLAELQVRCEVLDISEQTARHYAPIAGELRQAGKPSPTNDIWIAALCRQHDLPLLSQDRHFDAVPGTRRIAW
jgi:predicted nucleic acid-binding protein